MYLFRNDFSKQEESIDKILPILIKFANPKLKIIKHIDRIVEHHDDPKFFHFGAILNAVSKNIREENLSNSVGGYSFFSEDEALLKCLGEALERHCLRNYKKIKIFTSSYKLLKENAVNPKIFINFSNLQKENPKFKMFLHDESTIFSWIKGFDIIRNKTILIPAQLVFLSYKLRKKERWIYLPISVGAAGGGSLTGAIIRGIYEIIERDAFLIYYLNRMSGISLNLKSIRNEKIKNIIRAINDYNLELYCINIESELKIPTFLSIIIDKTGIGPAISMGLRSNLDPETAVLGSIQEALHCRGWIRKKVEENPEVLKKIKHKHTETLEERALLWYSKKNIKKLDFFLQQKKVKVKFKKNIISHSDQLKTLIDVLNKNKMSLFFVDITLPNIRRKGYNVVKVFIPELQPFYLIEDYPYFGGKRLYELPLALGLRSRTNEKNLNRIPHPFL